MTEKHERMFLEEKILFSLSHSLKQNKIRLKSGSSESLFFRLMCIFLLARCSAVDNYSDEYANENSAPPTRRQLGITVASTSSPA